MTYAARWPSPPLLEPVPCQYQGSMRHTRLIPSALMVNTWPDRSTNRRIG